MLVAVRCMPLFCVMALPQPDPDATCLITGASSGIGAELARGLAGRGHGVTLTARREERLQELADDLRQQHHVRVETIAVDITDDESRAALSDQLSEPATGPVERSCGWTRPRKRRWSGSTASRSSP
jgi:NADPH:quinone reductase-like Zn-dependent oxidoreductase